ncbi:MAG: tagaturonate reductase [Ilyomonas sp.]
MILNKENLSSISAHNVTKPAANVFHLPEKILQFGTGVLLRGLVDYFVDKANKQNIFDGRIVAVKSTDAGDIKVFEEQDNLYTLCIKGIEGGEKKEENIICGAISRVLSAKEEWFTILQCAHNEQLQIIVSNTTEVGIELIKEDIHQQPPSSFPAKLLAFLYERFKAFNGSAESGMTIIPTELIPDNAKKLLNILLQLSNHNNLDSSFIDWLKTCNHFCSSLVDRIVPGRPSEQVATEVEQQLGYQDKLLIVAEPYCLWAIEGDAYVQQMLSFASADKGVIIQPDIQIYRELKLRMLNATHTLTSGLAYLCGIQTVREAMENRTFSAFISDLMLKEIAPAIPFAVDPTVSHNYGLQVLDRFRNPSINHQWINITLQYTSKIKMRVIPILQRYYETFNNAPQHIAFGFAAYLLFMHPIKKDENKFWGKLNENYYRINDDHAAYFFDLHYRYSQDAVIEKVLSNRDLWGIDLTTLNNFQTSVKKYFHLLQEQNKDAVKAIVTL